MAANLTPGAITKIFSGACTSKDLNPVLQLIYIDYLKEGNEWRMVMLSDGSCFQYALIPDDIFISNKLQKGDIVRLTMFLLVPEKLFSNNINGALLSQSFIRVCGLDLLRSECHTIGHPKRYPLEESQTSKQRQDRVDPDVNENIDDSRHVEQPPTSKQNPSASTQNCSFHSLTQNKTSAIMGVNLTPGAITKIMTDKCSSTDLKPVVQVTNILIGRIRISTKNDKQHYKKVMLSDGSSSHFGCIADDIFISKKLQKGSIIQLTKFRLTKFTTYGDKRVPLIDDLNVIHSKCDIIVNREPFPCNDIPLLERSSSPITDDNNVDVDQAKEPLTSTQNCSETDSRKRKHQSGNKTPESDTNDDVDYSQNAQEPSATTQKFSSHSLTQSKKQKHQSSNDNVSTAVENVSKMTTMMLEKNRQDDVGVCFKRFETLEEVVSKMARMMTEKNKKDDVGACLKKLETLEEVVSKLTSMMMEKHKQDDVGVCFKRLETLEDNVSKMARMITEKNKEDDVVACLKKLETLEKDISKVSRTIMEENKEGDVGACFKKLETLEEVISKLMSMMMERNKEDDVGACFKKLEILENDISKVTSDVGACSKKLETLEEDVSKFTRMMIEKNKADDVGSCFKKLETLEKNISKMTRTMMDKNKEVDVGFKKLDALKEDVSEMTRMMIEKSKEDDVGACCKRLGVIEEDVSELTRMMKEKNKEDDMGACIEKLDKLGWEAEDPLYDIALLLFGQSADYRKRWLDLKPEICDKWVKNAGSMSGLLY